MSPTSSRNNLPPWASSSLPGELLTATVKAWREFAPAYFPLPHPSARNTPWFHRNPWFEHELLPTLRERVALARAV